MVQLLLDKGASANVKTLEEPTPLDLAVRAADSGQGHGRQSAREQRVQEGPPFTHHFCSRAPPDPANPASTGYGVLCLVRRSPSVCVAPVALS